MRITTSIIAFYVWLTAASNLLLETGFVAASNQQAPVAASDRLTQGIAQLQNIETGNIAAESLLGLYVAVSAAVEGFLTALTAGPQILLSLGVPMAFVAFLHAPLALVAGRFGIYVLSGRLQ